MKMAEEQQIQTLTARMRNIPESTTAQQLQTYLESLLGKHTIFALEIFTDHKNWKSRGYGRVQFEEEHTKTKALSLSQQRFLLYKGSYISLTHSMDDVITRPVRPDHRVDGLVLVAGIMTRSDCIGVLESWNGVKLSFMPERKKLQFVVEDGIGECYMLEVGFGDVVQSIACSFEDYDCGDKSNSILLKIKHAPKLFRKVSGPNVASRMSKDRYHICKEDVDFIWVRTTDFSKVKSIGYLSCLCWEIEEGLSHLDTYASLPYYQKDVLELSLEQGVKFPPKDIVPMVTNSSDFSLTYEVLFQINSLVHAQKISLAAVDDNLFQVLTKLDMDSALSVLKKLHKMPSTCYEPISFIENQCSAMRCSDEKFTSATKRKLNDHMMTCHRLLVTPSKIFCLGPEMEDSNYIVQNYSKYASDFVRVTFVDEDWGRLSAHAISTSIKRGIFAKPYRTGIYQRILSVLKDGIIIGDKKFEFLAFSASQLRSNAVWMFASNNDVKVDDIREWMGRFKKIKSISKCAARMGQLFSSSKQTIEVLPRDVKVIPDIEVTTDGVKYCFSDGIGKISSSFAHEISKKLGLFPHIPSAFQIRYGGYKGVIAVDSRIFKKLELRTSMLKFESDNFMLNVTKSCGSMPCYLNREIITLLSTLGVEDDAFLSLQEEQLQNLGKVLTDAKSSARVLESTGGGDIKSTLEKMLARGYEPTKEPYLLAMLRSHFKNQVSDLRSRCRIFVPKARVLVGCLDETGTLEYGQVYVRLTMNKSELQCQERNLFHRVDETTYVFRGKVVVTKNPCLHPGDVRVLQAVSDVKLEEHCPVNCIVFPQKGHRPHPNECSGGDLDGDQYFISWDKNLIPPRTVPPMDYTGRRARIMDHDVTLEEIQRFFADYIISDTLGAISTAHLVHADREPEKALSPKCLQLAALHSMAVDYAKTGAPAEMPRELKLREFPDFMERWEKPMYVSKGPLGKLYRATIEFIHQANANADYSILQISDAYDDTLVVDGYEAYIEASRSHKEQYLDNIDALMKYYGAESEIEILTGDLQNKSGYLQRDNRRYGEVKDRILTSVKSMMKDVKGWFQSACDSDDEQQKLASAWYYVTYHPAYCHTSCNCLGFPWVVGDILMDIKSAKQRVDVQPKDNGDILLDIKSAEQSVDVEPKDNGDILLDIKPAKQSEDVELKDNGDILLDIKPAEQSVDVEPKDN